MRPKAVVASRMGRESASILSLSDVTGRWGIVKVMMVEEERINQIHTSAGPRAGIWGADATGPHCSAAL